MIEPLLSAGLGYSAHEPDWTDVRRRARRLVARRLAARAGVVALVVLGAVLAATPALGLRGRVVELFSSGKPAPPVVVKDFAQLDRFAPPGMAPGVLADQARVVLEAPLSTGELAVLRVAPTRAGGFCHDLSTSGPAAEGAGGCDRDRALSFSPGLSIPGPISPQGEILEPPVVLDGDTLIRGAARVQVRFEDGEVAVTRVVWVSAPINAGFFVYEVPKAHWQVGHRPSTLVVLDAAGRMLHAAQSLPWPSAAGGQHGLSVFSMKAGLREESLRPGSTGIATVGGGASRTTAVLSFQH